MMMFGCSFMRTRFRRVIYRLVHESTSCFPALPPRQARERGHFGWMKELEEGSALQLDFTKLQKIAKSGSAVVPVVVQDADSRDVLVVAYANEAALAHTLKTGT